MTERRRALLLLFPLAAAGAWAGFAWWRGHGIGPVRRGLDAASAHGCFACHGPGGRLADPEGTRGIGTVPSFEREDVTAYARNAAEIREWILDGRPRRLREQDRGEPPNPWSLKGYVPSWSGSDFPELARDEGEIREWIRDGAPRRLRENPVAAFFLGRQTIRMPAFGDRVSEQEIREITTYIGWLRTAGDPPAPGR